MKVGIPARNLERWNAETTHRETISGLISYVCSILAAIRFILD